MDTIDVSQALQIAGRAGRFNTKYDHVSLNYYLNLEIICLFLGICDSNGNFRFRCSI